MKPLKGVIVAHSGLAEALIDAVAGIVGTDHGLIPLSNQGCGRGDLEQRVASVVAGEAAVIFVDLPSGSCSFAVMNRFRESSEVAIVTGVNLSMLIEFTFHRDLTPAELAQRAATAGRNAVEIHL